MLVDCCWLRRSGGLADRGGGTFDDSHDVGLLHDQEIFAIELDFGAGPLAEQDAVALLDVERNERALLIAGARANGDDLAFHRLFLGGVRNDDATLGLAFFLDALDHDTVVKRTELHVFPPKLRNNSYQHSPAVSANGARDVRAWVV